MDPEDPNERLSRISTMWTLVHQAHAGPADQASAAQRVLMQRYCGAVYRYLLGALGDEDSAMEQFQEFALRFVRGDFHRADPARGRFRDYVKTALIHLVTDYRKSQQTRPRPLPEDVPDARAADAGAADRDTDFIASWRDELLHQTWEALRQTHSTFHAVLLKQTEQPELPSSQKAEQLAAQLGEPMNAGQFRVTLHRAREKFADLLLAEVAHSLGTPSDAELIAELRELHLLKVCASAMERRAQRTDVNA